MRLFAFDDVRNWGKEICAAFSTLGHEAKLFTLAKEVPEGQDVVCFVHMHHRLAVRAKHKAMMEELNQKDLLLIPNIKEARLYDDKVEQFLAFPKWMPKTWYSQNFEETVDLTSKLSYPIISKCAEGSSSVNVRFIRNKEEAIQEAHRVFRGNGIQLYKCPIFQKGYVLWQEYLYQPEGNDWRITLVAKKYASVFERFVRKDAKQPFASGSGKRKAFLNIDFDVDLKMLSLFETTYRFATEVDLSMACVDIVYDSNNNPVILENACGWGMYAYPGCTWFERTQTGWKPTKYVGADMYVLIAKAIADGNFLPKVQFHPAKRPRYMKTHLFYPADEIKLRYVEKTISKILSLGEIKSAYDFGCGTGLYVQELVNQDVDTLGFEINAGAKKELKTSEENIVWADLEQPLSNNLKSRDLVITIEFLEHVTEKIGNLCCEEFCRLSSRWLVVTASPAKGEFHVNPQQRQYWINMIEKFGTHKYRDGLSLEFMKYFKKLIPNGLMWFKQNLMIFEKI